MTGKTRPSFATLAVHAGEPRPRIDNAVAMPIFTSTVYDTRELEEQRAGLDGSQIPAHERYAQLRYLRLSNTPNQRAVQTKLAALEGAEAALVTASGMAAISATLLTVLSPGDHLLVQSPLYGGTMAFVGRELVRLGIGHDFIDGGDPANWAAKVTPQTRAIYLETLSNPLVRIPALDSALEFARAHNLVSMIDNTFATPVGFRAVDFGFDLSLHSCTKYLGGHSDLIAGCVLGSAAWIDRIVERAADFGGCLAPLDCYLLQRSIKTLGPRMRAHNENALALAEILSRHPRVARVAYAGLPSDPDHQRSRFLSGCGGILAFEMRDGVDAATRLCKRFEYVTVAPSLGGVETTITRPASTSHFNVSRAERQRLGISDGLLRLSVGIESIDDLARDFAQALEG